MSSRRQGVYWFATAPHHKFTPYLPPQLAYIKGQLEAGEESGYLHWHFVCIFKKKASLRQLTELFGTGIKFELSRSCAAEAYVEKEDTAIPGTQFVLGVKPFRRESPTDWASVLELAKSGVIESIPPDVQVRCYNQLRRIGMDYVQPVAIVRTAVVYWGPTGTGKSRRAWDEAGLAAYSKSPTTKWFDGYQGQRNCIIDEFRGTISICHLLRWFDRYPVRVETKGASVQLLVERFWLTSNLDPRCWYPDVDSDTVDALMRRLEIVYIGP